MFAIKANSDFSTMLMSPSCHLSTDRKSGLVTFCRHQKPSLATKRSSVRELIQCGAKVEFFGWMNILAMKLKMRTISSRRPAAKSLDPIDSMDLQVNEHRVQSCPWGLHPLYPSVSCMQALRSRVRTHLHAVLHQTKLCRHIFEFKSPDNPTIACISTCRNTLSDDLHNLASP